MFSFYWGNNKFDVLQYGKGVFTCDMPGHSHSANSYELHYITNYIQIILSIIVRTLNSNKKIVANDNDDLNNKRFLLIEKALISNSKKSYTIKTI